MSRVKQPTAVHLSSAQIRDVVQERNEHVIDQYAAVMQKDDAMRVHGGEITEYMHLAWSLLTEDEKRQLTNTIHGMVMLFLRDKGGQFAKVCIGEMVDKLVREYLEAIEPQIREMIVKEVNDRWTSQVEQIVIARLESAVAKVKAEMCK